MIYKNACETKYIALVQLLLFIQPNVKQCVHDTDHPYCYKRVAILLHNMHSAIMHSNVQLAHSIHAGIMHSNVSLACGAASLELTTLGLRDCWLAKAKPFRRTAR